MSEQPTVSYPHSGLLLDLRDEIIRLRERVAVLESRVLFSGCLPGPVWQPRVPETSPAPLGITYPAPPGITYAGSSPVTAITSGVAGPANP